MLALAVPGVGHVEHAVDIGQLRDGFPSSRQVKLSRDGNPPASPSSSPPSGAARTNTRMTRSPRNQLRDRVGCTSTRMRQSCIRGRHLAHPVQ